MRAFIVKLENRPGTLADLGRALGDRGVNITGISAATWEDDGAIALITNDDSGTRSVLEERGATYRETELVSATIDDRPGALGEAARRLSDRDVNIETLIPTGMAGSRATIAFGVDDPAAAREALGELAATGSQAV